MEEREREQEKKLDQHHDRNLPPGTAEREVKALGPTPVFYFMHHSPDDHFLNGIKKTNSIMNYLM